MFVWCILIPGGVIHKYYLTWIYLKCHNQLVQLITWGEWLSGGQNSGIQGPVLTHLLLDKMAAILADDIFKCIFLNENDRISIQISMKFVLTWV